MESDMEHLINSCIYLSKDQKESQSTIHKPGKNLELQKSVTQDTFMGMRIINPIISSVLLAERLSGKKVIPFFKLPEFLRCRNLEEDWVISGVLTAKSSNCVSKKGEQYSLWRLSDLQKGLSYVTIFLFQNAHKDLWKVTQGMGVAILSPNVLNTNGYNNYNNIVSLSINSSQKVIILGKSKDFGICKGRKKNGEACSSVINLREGDCCVFHMKKEVSKLNSYFGCFGKNNGIKTLPSKGKPSVKVERKDSERLASLSSQSLTPFNNLVNPNATYLLDQRYKSGVNIDVEYNKSSKDLNRLKALQSKPNEATSKIYGKKSNNTDITSDGAFPNQLKADILCDHSFHNKRALLQNMKAVKLLKNHSIEKIDPNSLRGSHGVKRQFIDKLSETSDVKRQKLDEQKMENNCRLQRIVEANSLHKNLINEQQKEYEEKYFNKLERKEFLEEKLLSTYTIPCKAVICLVCKYTALSAGDRCKKELHQLKIIDTVKRFFQCKNCSYRTVTLFRFPTTTCKLCKSSQWQRTAMIRDNTINSFQSELSVRGDEEKFLNSTVGKCDINLLVPITE